MFRKRWASLLAMKNLLACAFLLLCASSFAIADPPVSLAFAEFKHSLDFSKAEAGQIVELRLLKNVVVDNRVAIPRDSIVKAHIAAVEKEGKHLRIQLALDAAKVGASDVGIVGIIVAIAPAPKLDLAADPHASMLSSNEATRNDSSRNMDSESNAAVGAALKLHHENGSPLGLNERSQGAIEIEAKLDWNVASPPPVTIIESKGKRLTLEAGTQVLIRMAEPKSP
ncbi:MAG: hypothetical protein JWO13_329 [Acidobacteriales bacterium]|nr:hypothetical protein [Terriglobales bacterium]